MPYRLFPHFGHMFCSHLKIDKMETSSYFRSKRGNFQFSIGKEALRKKIHSGAFWIFSSCDLGIFVSRRNYNLATSPNDSKCLPFVFWKNQFWLKQLESCQKGNENLKKVYCSILFQNRKRGTCSCRIYYNESEEVYQF